MNPLVLGITGPSCSGKSSISKALKKQFPQLKIIALDALGHQALKTRKKQLVHTFSESVLDESGEVSREILGELVFKDQQQLRKLEAIVHPFIQRKASQKVAHCRQKGRKCLLEGALIYPLGLHSLCDVIITLRTGLLTRFYRAWILKHYSLDRIFYLFLLQRRLNFGRRYAESIEVSSVREGIWKSKTLWS